MLQPGEKVLLVGEHRKLHWAAPWRAMTGTTAAHPAVSEGAKTATRRLDAIAAAGFTHVFFNLKSAAGPPTRSC